MLSYNDEEAVRSFVYNIIDGLPPGKLIGNKKMEFLSEIIRDSKSVSEAKALTLERIKKYKT